MPLATLQEIMAIKANLCQEKRNLKRVDAELNKKRKVIDKIMEKVRAHQEEYEKIQRQQELIQFHIRAGETQITTLVESMKKRKLKSRVDNQTDDDDQTSK